MSIKSGAGLLLLLSASSFAEDCVPPGFYISLPRDREWYYGAGKDPDPEMARQQALRSLGKQVTGDVETWGEADLGKVAGPGRDRWETAKVIGDLLPKSTLLAGWEQDDRDRCAGVSYALVRIEKERVERFLKESAKFKQAVLDSLAGRVEKAEKNIAALQSDYGALKQRLAALERKALSLSAATKDHSARPASAPITEKIAAIKDGIAAKRPAAVVAKELEAAERLLSVVGMGAAPPGASAEAGRKGAMVAALIEAIYQLAATVKGEHSESESGEGRYYLKSYGRWTLATGLEIQGEFVQEGPDAMQAVARMDRRVRLPAGPDAREQELRTHDAVLVSPRPEEVSLTRLKDQLRRNGMIIKSVEYAEDNGATLMLDVKMPK